MSTDLNEVFTTDGASAFRETFGDSVPKVKIPHGTPRYWEARAIRSITPKGLEALAERCIADGLDLEQSRPRIIAAHKRQHPEVYRDDPAPKAKASLRVADVSDPAFGAMLGFDPVAVRRGRGPMRFQTETWAPTTGNDRDGDQQHHGD